MISFLQRLFSRPRGVNLLAMRLADMHYVHPQQIEMPCSSCGHTVAIYPSGQLVIRSHRDVKVICNVCQMPGEDATFAPGAELEPMQSVRRRPS